MSRTSALGNFTLLPVLADAADITAVGTTMADRIEKYVVMRFATIAARDAAITSPEEGMVAVITNDDRYWIYSGAAWVFMGYYAAAGRTGAILTDTGRTITTATLTDIVWTAETQDVDGWGNGVANITVPTGWGGRALVSHHALWSSSSLGTTPAIAAFVNGGQIEAADGLAPQGIHTLAFTRLFAAADTIKFQAFQNSGGSVTVTSRVEIHWLGI